MNLIGRGGMWVGVLLAALCVPSVGRSTEVDELKATAEQLIAALNKGDLDTWSTLVHNQAVGFYAFSPFPVEGKAALRQNFQGLLSTTESLTITPLNFQYRVVGDTGYTWGHVVIAFKPKDGPLRITWVRELMTYAKVGGKWQMVTVHVSAIPANGL
ncbi:MAG: nuclear transport factor 2 family protein [Deltaproteobacteria bacterium]|nr:nuclear transport factor 2 family protein [Deltaproteobacteria bacterium]